jgi:putative transposase
MAVREELLEELMKDYKNPEDLLGENGIMRQLYKGLLEKAMQGELTHHLGYDKNALSEGSNYRNGKSSKKVKSKSGKVEVNIPRDRNGSFEPQIIKKHARRFDGFEEKIISMYARGMTVRDIQEHLKDIYNTEVSHDFISTVTDTVVDEVRAWQTRPLDEIYPIVFLDAIFVKVRDNSHIVNKAIYFALGVTMEGQKELLGMWIAQTEGAKFWLNVITELKNRGIQDIFIACIDGLKGFPEAIEGVFPKTEIQLCIVHMTRNSLNYVSWKDKKQVAAGLRQIYGAPTEEAAKSALDNFALTWDSKYPRISSSWKNNWDRLVPFLAYPEDIRKAIYTTNAIESLNNSLKKVIKNRGAFPNDEAVLKLLYLAMRNISKKWTMPIRCWKEALNQFAIIFGDRFPDQL